MKPITGRFVLGVTVAFFGTVLAANIVMMRIAISTMPGVNVDSAYSASLAYEKEIANARRQDQRDWTVNAHVERTRDGNAMLQIDARDAKGKPITGLSVQCRFERPADRRGDISVSLDESGGGAYRGIVPGIAAGQWDLVIESRAADQVVFMSKNRMNLGHE